MENNNKFNASIAWRKALNDIISLGEPVTTRNGNSLEILNHTVAFNMEWPTVISKHRRFSYNYMKSEALWTIYGSNRLDWEENIGKTLSPWSEDGIYLNGAYGPRFVDQMPYILDNLSQDLGSRQAVMTIWRPSPRVRNDMPCLVSLQFLIRDNTLYTIANMRSSDAWLGLPNDMFVISMMSACMAIEYNFKTKRGLKLGFCFLNAGSRHLYSKDTEDAEICEKEITSEDSRVQFSLASYPEFVAWLGNRGTPRNNIEIMKVPWLD